MSTETNALSAVEKETSERQLTQCRKIICAVEKGDVRLAARLFEALRKMLRGIEKNSRASADERLDAIALLARLKKANRGADQDDAPDETPKVTSDTDRRFSVDAHDCLRAQTAVLGHSWGHRIPLSRYDKEALLSELLGEVTVPVVQQLILDMRRPNPQGGLRLSSFVEIFDAAQWYLEDHGATELPRESADLEYDRDDKTFQERMRERGAVGY